MINIANLNANIKVYLIHFRFNNIFILILNLHIIYICLNGMILKANRI